MVRTAVVRVAVVLSALAAPGAAQGQVWVVGPAPGPGIDFTGLQAAIDAAADGDAILVKPGSYAALACATVSGKSLSIEADGGGTASFSAGLRVENLAPSQSFLVRGLTLSVSTPEGAPKLAVISLENVRGSAWIEETAVGSTVTWPRAGLAVVDSRAVAVQRCSLAGADLAGMLSPISWPTDGVWLMRSSLALHDCDAFGSVAGFFYPGTSGLDGGAGARVTNGFLFAGGSRFVGGDAGPASGNTSQPCPPAGDGGHGLIVGGLFQKAVVQDCQFSGGMAGTAPACSPPGKAGQALYARPGGLAAIPGPGHSFEATSPAREGQSTALTFGGLPGDLVLAAWSTQPGFTHHAPAGGVILLGAPVSVAAFGAIPPSGSDLVVNVPIGELGPGVEFARVFVQSAAIDPTTLAISIGGASSVLLLDAAY